MDHGQISGVPLPVARLILGTMILSSDRQDDADQLLDDALNLGLTAFDLAHVYGGGGAERAMGSWLARRGVRDQVVLISKGAHPNGDRQRVTPYDIGSDLLDSLARLRVDRIDLYLLHRDDPRVPVGEIVEALAEHQRAGRIGAYGGSNWTHERLEAANRYAASHGLPPLAASSPNYGLAEQVEDPWGPGCVGLGGPAQAEARAWYQTKQLPILAYSSLGRGFFSGRISRATFEQQRGSIDGACLRAYCHEVNFRRLDRVEAFAQQTGLTVPQVALRWVLSQPLNVFALVGAASRAEMEGLLPALARRLTPAESAWLDLASDAQPF